LFPGVHVGGSEDWEDIFREKTGNFCQNMEIDLLDQQSHIKEAIGSIHSFNTFTEHLLCVIVFLAWEYSRDSSG
jgi:hypothetical protein